MIKKILLLLFCTIIFSSCVSRKKIVYLQDISSTDISAKLAYESRLKPDDLLMIIVSSAGSPEAAADFNLPIVGVTGSVANGSIDSTSGQLRVQSYLRS